MKKISVFFYSLIITAVFSVSPVFAQETPEKKENVVEYTYICYVDVTILLEAAKELTKEHKLIALEYIEDMLERNNNDHVISVMHETLKYLSFEGTVNAAIEDKTQNDFPDVRRKAVKLLGQLGTIESKNEDGTNVLFNAIIEKQATQN